MRNRLVLLAVVVLALAGCQGSKKRVIAVIPKGTAHLFWVTVHEGAEDAGKEFGVDIEWNGPAQETDYGRQLEIMDSMINRHVDGIVVAATEKKVLNQSLARAKQMGIPVTVFDSGVDSDDYVSFVATNNYEAGRMGARKLAALLDGKGKVAVVMNAPGSASTVGAGEGVYRFDGQGVPGDPDCRQSICHVGPGESDVGDREHDDGASGSEWDFRVGGTDVGGGVTGVEIEFDGGQDTHGGLRFERGVAG